MDTEFHWGGKEKVLETDGGDGCTKMYMHLMPTEMILKNC